MLSSVGYRVIIEEVVVIVLVSDEEDLNSDGNGRRDICVIF